MRLESGSGGSFASTPGDCGMGVGKSPGCGMPPTSEFIPRTSDREGEYVGEAPWCPDSSCDWSSMSTVAPAVGVPSQ